MNIVVHPSTSSPEKPDYLPDYFYCYSCQSIIDLALYRLAGKKKASDIDDALAGICKGRNYPEHKYLATEMRESCEQFMASYSETVEDLLLERKTDNVHEL